LVALLLAFLVHGVWFLCIWLMTALGWLESPAPHPIPKSDVDLMTLAADQWDQNRKVGPAPKPNSPAFQKLPAPAAVPVPEKKAPEAIPKGQIVDVAPGNDEKPNDDAKYLAEHNNKVEKESRAKDQTAFYKNAMPHRTTTLPPNEHTGHDNVDHPSLSGNQGTANDEREKKDGKQAGHFEVPTTEHRDQVAVVEKGTDGEISNQKESDQIKGNSDKLRISAGDQGPPDNEPGSLGKAGSRNVANLLPSQATVDKITGAAANDHLDGVEQGEGTYLNTREWKYATFFNRVKQSVGEHWDPSTPLRQRDPDGRVYAYKDRYTLLTVTLDDIGRVKALTIEKSCGVDFLDHEAVAAFERAQPFPNPPPGLLNSNQEIHFSFGFFLEVNSGSSLHLFRSRD
jgi:TonB family protein